MRPINNIIRSIFGRGGSGGGGSYTGPKNTAAPVISGVIDVGQTLSSTTGTWTGSGAIAYSYQWQRSGVNITAETANTYLLDVADENELISCIITATDNNGSRSRRSNVLGPVTLPLPVNTVAPVISGVPQITETLSCSTGTWTGTGLLSYTYQWRRGLANISGATASTYLLDVADENALISCLVTATDDYGPASVLADAVGPVAGVPLPVNTALPVISGVAQVLETLTCSTGTWTGTGILNYTYQWRSDEVNIIGETANTYQLQFIDIDTMISCQVTATDDYGPTSVFAVEVGPVESNNNAFSDPFRDPFQDTLLEFDPLFIINEVS